MSKVLELLSSDAQRAYKLRRLRETAVARLPERSNDGKPSISLAEFMHQAWPILEPNRKFMPNWHIDAVAEHLQAVSERQIRRLIINIPPRMAKSFMGSVLWQPWEWTWKPHTRWLVASYSWNFAKRDAVRSRSVINSVWYQHKFGHIFQMRQDQNEKNRYVNTAEGFRLSTSVGGTAVGDGGDTRLIDDPIKPSDIWSETKRERVIDWWRNTWSSRTNDPDNDADVIIMQRLHDSDLSGYILDELGGTYEHLNLPMRFDPERRSVTSIGWRDPRTKDGELLHEERFSETAVSELEAKLGDSAEAQLQQDPAGSGGNIIKGYWFRFWIPPGMPISESMVRDVSFRDEKRNLVQCPIVARPSNFDEIGQSWDLAFKKSATTSDVVGAVWGRLPASYWLLDMDVGKRDFSESMEAIKRLTKRWPTSMSKLIEDKANGPAAENMLGTEIEGMILVPVGQSGKVARLHAVSPLFKAGNVYLPHPALFDWVTPYIKELTRFPNSKDNGRVDTTSQILQYWFDDVWTRS